MKHAMQQWDRAQGATAVPAAALARKDFRSVESTCECPISLLIDKPHTEGEGEGHGHPRIRPWPSAGAVCAPPGALCNLASHHVLGFTVSFALLVYFAFAILFLLLRYAVLPNIDFYKGDIERMASRALGNQVTIARIYASWRGLHPNLFLGDVVLRDAPGRQLLALPSVSATSPGGPCWPAEPRFESLEMNRPEPGRAARRATAPQRGRHRARPMRRGGAPPTGCCASTRS